MNGMHLNHTLYEEARNKLAESGLSERVKDNRGALTFIPSPCRDDLRGYVQEMEDRGFFKDDTPFEEMFYNQLYTRGEKYSPYHKLVEAIENFDSPQWQMDRSDGEIFEGIDIQHDSPIVLGYLASQVLAPDEFWNPEGFGFGNVSDFWGSVGTLIENMDHPVFRKGYIWNSSYNGRRFSTEVTGSFHGDFRLIRTDVTNYRTIDPVGKEVSYRPVLDQDEGLVAAYHSVETNLLASILKWCNEEKIPIDAFEKPDEFLQKFEGKEKLLGNFAESGIHNSFHIHTSFMGTGFPMARLDEENIQKNKAAAIDDLFVDADKGQYQIAIDSKGDLAFCYVDNNTDMWKERKRTSSLTIPKEEANELVYGLFEQARRGLGRTSFGELEAALKFTETEEYEMMLEKGRKNYDESLN